MPKLTGIFSNFKSLNSINPEDISKWLNFKVEPHTLENFIAQRIIYPQTIPQALDEMEIDLGILREVIKANSDLFYNPSKGSLIVPLEFESRFPDLKKLIWAFCDSLSFGEVTKVYSRTISGNKLIGSVLTISDLETRDNNLVIAFPGGAKKEYKIPTGSLTTLPLEQKSATLTLNSKEVLEVFGGRLGMLLDLRKK